MQVKICGVTTAADARAAADAGANYIGLIRAESPRRVPDDQIPELLSVLPEHVAPVLLYVDAPPAEIIEEVEHLGVHHVQLHGHETPQAVETIQRAVPGLNFIRAVQVRADDDPADHVADVQALADRARGRLVVIVDAPKGAPHPGYAALQTVGQQLVAQGFPVWCAGKLTPENLPEAIPAGSFHGVDVASGVEQAPGVKDPLAMQAFVRAARAIAPAPLKAVP